LPVVVRVDGKSFHSFTKGLDKPYDVVIGDAMDSAMMSLCKEISGTKFGYVQSDEISIVFTNDDTLMTEPWFDNQVQKIASITASVATRKFNEVLRIHPENTEDKLYYTKIDRASFDSRVFVLPDLDEVVNYFVWRQADATRNAIQGLAQAHFSHNQLMGLKLAAVQDKLFVEKGINFNDEPTGFKRGRAAVRVECEWKIDKDVPIFSKDRDYVLSRLSYYEDAS
jgi:tRNA(His) 5'-end guanylyltransferase